MRYQRVLLLGDGGFLGRHVARELTALGHTLLVDQPGDTWARTDLRSIADTIALFDRLYPIDCVVNAAGWNGNIATNRNHAWKIFRDNTLMGLNVLEAARTTEVKKVVSLVASCAYPDHDRYHDVTNAPDGICVEEDFLNGRPNPTVACHAYAKRNVYMGSTFLSNENLRCVTLCPSTLYGPGDRYDLSRVKVVGALVKRFVDAATRGDDQVTLWGTGKPLRDITYVEDAAWLVASAVERYEDTSYPLNLSSGVERSVADLARTIAGLAGFTGRIDWDQTRPDGQYRKKLDCSSMRILWPNFTFRPVEDALRATIEDYRSLS